MLNIEKFMLLTIPYADPLTEVESLFLKARTALTLVEFERTHTVRFAPADATKAWDYENPLIKVEQSRLPDAVGLNEAFKKLPKFHDKPVSAALGNKKLDPAKGIAAEFARQGILAGDPKQYQLVATDALEAVRDDLGLALRDQREVTKEDRVLLEVIEAINATQFLLGSQQPEWSTQQFSAQVHRYPSGHPVVAQLVKDTSSMSSLMEKSKLAQIYQKMPA
ncbi:MAG TPA: hypothetical protein H9884_05650 [Candidatus Yaniella excrementigallinarum]|nr:hypothetical protein [Candidatus Yaniella excrementigallinarum]